MTPGGVLTWYCVNPAHQIQKKTLRVDLTMAQVEGNPALPDLNALNDAEKRHLLHVMKRAKDVEVIEGTNH